MTDPTPRLPAMALNALCIAAGLCLAAPGPASARVLRLEILSTESPAFGGRVFGAVGTYDKLLARVTTTTDPALAQNAGVADIGLAPRGASGGVEATADVVILRPTVARRGNGVMLYDVVNRGSVLSLELLNGAPYENALATAADAGNGHLMRQGYTLVASGWQFDVPPSPTLLRLQVPVIPGLTGLSREEFVFDSGKRPLIGRLTYPVAGSESRDPTVAPASTPTLTMRTREADPRSTPPGLSFRQVDDTHIEITPPPQADAGSIYEFIYTVRDPVPAGLAFASVRDVVAHLRREPLDAEGHANPLFENGRPTVSHAYAYGISQSGRFLRDFLWRGFNLSEARQPVFDGLMVHVAGTRRSFVNPRWAQPGRYSRQHEDHLYPDDQFPFTYGVTHDALSGRTDGLLSACLTSGSCPKVIQTDTDTETRQARLSLLVTDTAGRDIALPSNVRAYYQVGMPHYSPGPVAGVDPTCQRPFNPLEPGASERALLAALDAWVRRGTAPPPSRMPSVRGGGWVVPAQGRVDWPGWDDRGLINGVSVVDASAQPPREGKAYPVYLPRLDADGIATDGLKLPAVAVPRASYLGWNLRRAGHAEGELCGLTGTTFPFARMRSEREAAGDPRPSIAERYASDEAYVNAVRKATKQLVRSRLMLPEDAEAAIAEARAGRLAGLAP